MPRAGVRMKMMCCERGFTAHAANTAPRGSLAGRDYLNCDPRVVR